MTSFGEGLRSITAVHLSGRPWAVKVTRTASCSIFAVCVLENTKVFYGNHAAIKDYTLRKINKHRPKVSDKGQGSGGREPSASRVGVMWAQKTPHKLRLCVLGAQTG